MSTLLVYRSNPRVKVLCGEGFGEREGVCRKEGGRKGERLPSRKSPEGWPWCLLFFLRLFIRFPLSHLLVAARRQYRGKKGGKKKGGSVCGGKKRLRESATSRIYFPRVALISAAGLPPARLAIVTGAQDAAREKEGKERRKKVACRCGETCKAPPRAAHTRPLRPPFLCPSFLTPRAVAGIDN